MEFGGVGEGRARSWGKATSVKSSQGAGKRDRLRATARAGAWTPSHALAAAALRPARGGTARCILHGFFYMFTDYTPCSCTLWRAPHATRLTGLGAPGRASGARRSACALR